MKVIYKGRGEGKTTKLIEESAQTGIYILCANRSAAQNIFNQAHDLNLNIPFPVTVEEYFRTHGFRGSFIREVLIDDADLVLQTVFDQVRIDEISLTNPDEIEEVF